MMTFKVYIQIGRNEREVYVQAKDAAQAIARVRVTLDGYEYRWANVFC